MLSHNRNNFESKYLFLYFVHSQMWYDSGCIYMRSACREGVGKVAGKITIIEGFFGNAVFLNF